MNKSYIAKLANKLLNEGLAYDKSHAFKLAYAGKNDFYQFGFVDGRFIIEPRV